MVVPAFETCKTISTHTLTWSVTSSPGCIPSKVRISTHTLTWSVTNTAIYNSLAMMNFNSHAHVERDLDWKNCGHTVADFNSHAHVERDPMTPHLI